MRNWSSKPAVVLAICVPFNTFGIVSLSHGTISWYYSLAIVIAAIGFGTLLMAVGFRLFIRRH